MAGSTLSLVLDALLEAWPVVELLVALLLEAVGKATAGAAWGAELGKTLLSASASCVTGKWVTFSMVRRIWREVLGATGS